MPIVHYAVAKKEQDEEEMKGVTEYLKKTCDKRLINETPITFKDLANIEECVGEFVTHLGTLNEKYESMKNDSVKTAFTKFDKDGNGTIDPQELG